MNRYEIVESLRAEIAHLQNILDLMEEVFISAPERRGPGRPKGASSAVARAEPGPAAPTKRVMSAEGKARIAAAQKKRWAKVKRATASNPQNSRSLPAKRSGSSKASKAPTGSQPAKKTVAKPKKGAQLAAKKKASAVSRPAKAAAEQTPATES